MYIVLFFIQRMLHSISSKSLVLPYGKYRVGPTPLPPAAAGRESSWTHSFPFSSAVHGFYKNVLILQERGRPEPTKRSFSQVEKRIFLENRASGPLNFRKNASKSDFLDAFFGDRFWIDFWSPQDGPRSPQEGPRSPQERPKRRQAPPQEVP